MSNCPFCQADLPDDFGLIDCPGCEAALFIEMDGTVQSTSLDSPSEESVESSQSDKSNSPVEEEVPYEESMENFSESSLEEEATDFSGGEELEDFSDPLGSPDDQQEFDQGSVEESSAEDFSASMDPETFQSDELQENFGEESQLESFEMGDPQLEVASMVADSLDQVDISQLATALDERGSVEGLLYNLTISGIDTADLRKEVLESLTDKKLGWNSEDLLSGIKNGTLEIKSISAVKAHVVLQRLKVLSIHLKWEQHESS
ncbi:MAG: hypothetical protein GW917_00635 [Bdellovibrionales bacterium]|nr:hypothetical protein [Bdellovibrionales bacterium]